MTHTKGPWDIGINNTTILANLLPIAQIEKWADEDWQANARLITAAPELLQALKDLTSAVNISKLNVKKTEDFSLLNAHACALKTINKAEGK